MKGIRVTYHYEDEPLHDHEEILSIEEAKDLYPNYASVITLDDFYILTFSYDQTQVTFTPI